jgi:hypothetical protein
MFINFVNGADVRVIQRGSGFCLALEPFQRLRIVSNFFRKEFQCDKPAKPDVS